MAAITFELPDTLAKYADEQGVFTPEWFADITRASLEKLRSMRVHKQEAAGKVPSKEKWEDTLDWMTGCCKGMPGTVDEFLAECHADREREFELEECPREEERRYARLPA